MTNRTSSVSFQAPWEVEHVSVRVCVCVCVWVCVKSGRAGSPGCGRVVAEGWGARPGQLMA